MGRAPCCEKMGLKKGPWTKEEDEILIHYINRHGHGNWRALPKQAGLLRCGKSCRLRWINYLRPDIKRGNFSHEEEDAIIKLHQALGNRWSVIAARLPGRTDNEIKNIWHTRLKKRLNDYGLVPAQPRLKIESQPLITLNMDFPMNGSLLTMNSPAHSSTTTSTDVHASSSSISSDCVASDAVLQSDLPVVDESFWSQVFSSENSSDAGELPATVDGGNHFDSTENEIYETKSSREFWHGLFSKGEDLPVLPEI